LRDPCSVGHVYNGHDLPGMGGAITRRRMDVVIFYDLAVV
jgi:hypothetical protein